jgi:hypothetical protein
MSRIIALVLVVCVAGFVSHAHPQDTNDADTVRFAWIDLFIDSGDAPLAAYQIDLTTIAGDVAIVGVEGGAHDAFTDAPHYDPAALRNDHLILADFSLADADALPTGRTRIARIHVQITGDAEPDFNITLEAAADDQGKTIAADANWTLGSAS